MVIVPIYKTDEQLATINEKATEIKKSLEAKGISVKFDNDDKQKPGWKFAEYEMKGVPIRIAMGPRDIENGTVEIARRDTGEKHTYSFTDLTTKVEHLLEQIQLNIYQKALDYRDEHITRADTWDEFVDILENKTGFVSAHWDGTSETELKIKEKTKATIRCIELNAHAEEGKCILTGNLSHKRVLFAKAY